MRLNDHGAHALLDDEQPFANFAQCEQVLFDVFDAVGLSQIGVDHDDAFRPDANIVATDQRRLDTVLRFQQRAHLRYLVRLVGEKMYIHEVVSAAANGHRAGVDAALKRSPLTSPRAPNHRPYSASNCKIESGDTR